MCTSLVTRNSRKKHCSVVPQLNVWVGESWNCELIIVFFKGTQIMPFCHFKNGPFKPPHILVCGTRLCTHCHLGWSISFGQNKNSLRCQGRGFDTRKGQFGLLKRKRKHELFQATCGEPHSTSCHEDSSPLLEKYFEAQILSSWSETLSFYSFFLLNKHLLFTMCQALCWAMKEI